MNSDATFVSAQLKISRPAVSVKIEPASPKYDMSLEGRDHDVGLVQNRCIKFPR
jgi:hypothetical protein